MVGQVMTRLYVGLVPVQPLLSVTRTVIGNVPPWVGVPESTPFGARVRPVGSVPLASVNVAVPMAPVCVNVSLNGEPAGPVAFAGLVTVMVWQLMMMV